MLAVRETPGVGLARPPDQLAFRTGGERCRPAGRGHSQTLKKLLQEYRVPHWWRDRVPLWYCDGQLAAVGDLWICEGFQASEGASGWSIEWQREAPTAPAD